VEDLIVVAVGADDLVVVAVGAEDIVAVAIAVGADDLVAVAVGPEDLVAVAIAIRADDLVAVAAVVDDLIAVGANFSSGGGASHGSRKEKKLGGLDAEGRDLYAFVGCSFFVGQFIPRLNEQRVPRHTDAAMPYKNEKAENGQAPNKRERRE